MRLRLFGRFRLSVGRLDKTEADREGCKALLSERFIFLTLTVPILTSLTGLRWEAESTQPPKVCDSPPA
jgi:hypothetical protein